MHGMNFVQNFVHILHPCPISHRLWFTHQRFAIFTVNVSVNYVMHAIDYYHHCTLIYTHGAMGCMNLCAAASVNTLINLNCAATASHRCCCPNALTGMKLTRWPLMLIFYQSASIYKVAKNSRFCEVWWIRMGKVFKIFTPAFWPNLRNRGIYPQNQWCSFYYALQYW